jgi:hypothetical protein
MRDNLSEGRHILTDLEHFDAFTDLEYLKKQEYIEAYRFYPQFCDQVENCRFILNIRDREQWVGSRLDHNDGAYADIMMKVRGKESLTELCHLWRAEWDQHVAEVKAYLPDDQLLVLDIDADSFARIDEFLELSLPKGVYLPPANFTRSRLSRKLSVLAPDWLKSALPKNLKQLFHYKLRKRR